MKKTLALLSLIVSMSLNAAKIGTWRTFPSYEQIEEIVPAGEKIYVLASGGVYSYDPETTEVTTLDRSNALSDSNAKLLGWSREAKRLIIVYENGNIDILNPETDEAVNLPDFMRKSVSGSKTVNRVDVFGSRAYISTGFGVLAVNMKEATIEETWNLGQDIWSVTFAHDRVYLCSWKHIYWAKTGDNLLDRTSWQDEGKWDFRWLVTLDGSLLGLQNGSVKLLDKDLAGAQEVFTPWFREISINDNHLTLTSQEGINFQEGLTWQDCHVIYTTGISHAVWDERRRAYWWARDSHFLERGDVEFVSFSEGNLNISVSGIAPQSPKSNAFGFLLYQGGRMYGCNGTSASEKDTPVIQYLDKDGSWHAFQSGLKPLTGHLEWPVTAIAIDPKDSEHVFAGTQNGLYEYQNGQFKNYYCCENSPIVPFSEGEHEYEFVRGLCFDRSGTLWLCNSFAKGRSIIEMSPQKKFTSHDHPAYHNFKDGGSGGMLSRMTEDSRGLIWTVNNNWAFPAFFCYQRETGAVNCFRTFINQDGTDVNPQNGVTCVAEDLNGDIWAGTDKGPVVLRSGDIGQTDPVLYQVKVPRNDGTNLADYLLSGVWINDIRIDEMGRKWFATAGQGVYLIDKDNITELAHFTKENSLLLSNEVLSVEIDQNTKEVFFGTKNGLCAYQSDITQSGEPLSDDAVWAYPNPVSADFQGEVTIVGLTSGAGVTITNTAGHLVSKGRATGGSYQWDLRDTKGKPVASGIYIALISTPEGGKGTVCKIAVIR